MKSGWLCTKGFVSSFALVILIYVFSFGYVHYKIIANIMFFQKRAKQLEIKTYLEVALVQRIRNAYVKNEVNDVETLAFQMYEITISCLGDDIRIEFNSNNDIAVIEYEYDEATQRLIRK